MVGNVVGTTGRQGDHYSNLKRTYLARLLGQDFGQPGQKKKKAKPSSKKKVKSHKQPGGGIKAPKRKGLGTKSNKHSKDQQNNIIGQLVCALPATQAAALPGQTLTNSDAYAATEGGHLPLPIETYLSTCSDVRVMGVGCVCE